MNEQDVVKTIQFVVVGVLAFILIFSTVVIVPAGYRGVLMTFGKPSMDTMGEGIHFKIPLAQTVKNLEVRTTKLETNADAASRDLQEVQTTIAVNYHLIPGEVPLLYQEVGLDYQERIISPALQESVKAITSKFTAEELVTRRPEVSKGIHDFLNERLSAYHIKVDDFNIVNFQFSEEFDKAIEQKVTAEQLKLKAERDLERIIIEKDQQITQAQAEAESLRLQKAEITPDLLRLREIEVASKAIDKWNGILPQVTGGAIPFISLADMNNQPPIVA